MKYPWKEEFVMPCFTVALDPSVEMFYRRIAAQAELPLESVLSLSLIHISEPTRQAEISYAVFCLKKKKKKRCTSDRR